MAIQYLTVPRLTTKELKRIFAKIEIRQDLQHNGTPCWIWCNGRSDDGYGISNFKGRGEAAHRLMFAWLVHPLPRGCLHGQLDHLCRRPSCCNPLHLEFVSCRENILRGNGIAAQCARRAKSNYNAQQREYRKANRDVLLAKRREKYQKDKVR